MGLDRLAWRTVAARPLRSLLTIIGIALGIAVLSASLTLGAALDQAVDRTVHDMVGRADLRVSAFLDAGLTDTAVNTIRDTDGVRSGWPVIQHRTFLGSAPGGGGSVWSTPTPMLRTQLGAALRTWQLPRPST